MQRPDVKLIIFDCDGVLVDSEMLSASVLMRLMGDAGLPITQEIFRQDFLGRSFKSAAEKTKLRFNRELPEDFQFKYRFELLDRMKRNLREMHGVKDVLKSIRSPYCLATGSSPERLEVSMEVTGLKPWFAGRSYTSNLVEHGKPSPELFYYAAHQMNIEPKHCLVIEDSEMGLRAGLAAGMTTWQFKGGSHYSIGLEMPPDVKPDAVIADMPALHLALAECGLCV